MTNRQQLLESIAKTSSDYRSYDLAAPTLDHVDRWISQFDRAVQLPILAELDHVLKRTYFSMVDVTEFLSSLLNTRSLVGNDPCAFWKSANFLDIQQGGNSQREMLALFSELLAENCNCCVRDCGKGTMDFIYLDDAVFTGNRVRRDIEAWIAEHAPNKANLHIISIALHSGGKYYADEYISSAMRAAGKEISVTWYSSKELEDRRTYNYSSDVLRPTEIPAIQEVQAYVNEMTYKPTLRQPGHVGRNGFFSGEDGRSLLERELLIAGVRIRQMCPNLGVTQRPLGHISLETLGFGSLIVTFRNCPNNAPLALWVGDPWYPLFPRTTNRQTAHRRMIESFMKGDA